MNQEQNDYKDLSDPPHQPTSGIRERMSYNKIASRISAVVAGSLIGAGVVHSVEDKHDPPRSINYEHHTQPDVLDADTVMQITALSAIEDDATPPAELVQEYTEALKDDECAPSTPENAAIIYHETYEINNYESMSDDELLAHVGSEVAAFEKTRDGVSFPEFPKDFANLYNDTAGLLPVSRYVQAMQEQFSQADITANIAWDDTAEHAPSEDKGMPYTSEELETAEVKAGLRHMMQEFALLPLDVLKMTELPSVFIGKSMRENVSAYANKDSDAKNDHIFFDPKLYFESMVGHEFSHATSNVFCYAVADVAWTALNPDGYDYGKSDSDTYNDAEKAFRNEGKGNVVAARGYGDTNAAEDFATLFGETVLYPGDRHNIYSLPVADRTVPDKKVALMIARMHEQKPQVANYMVEEVRLLQLRGALEAASQSYYNSFVSKYVHGEPGSDEYNQCFVIPAGSPQSTELQPYYRVTDGIKAIEASLRPVPGT